MKFNMGIKVPCDYCKEKWEATSHITSIQLEDAPLINICDKCLFEKLTNRNYEKTKDWLKFVKRKESKKWWQFWI